MNISVNPPNSIVILLDAEIGNLPGSLDASMPITATESALVISTYADVDGPTKIYLASDLPPIQGLVRRWSGSLVTTGKIAVEDIYQRKILSAAVPSNAIVEVFTNDFDEPDVIAIVVCDLIEPHG